MFELACSTAVGSVRIILRSRAQRKKARSACSCRALWPGLAVAARNASASLAVTSCQPVTRARWGCEEPGKVANRGQVDLQGPV